jgi:WD40 repeat protein
MVLDPNTGAILWSRQELGLPQAMSVVFSPDGRSLAAGFGEYSQRGVHSFKLYDSATGQTTATYPGPKGGVNALAFDSTGRHLAVAGLDIVEIWDVVAQRRIHELRGHFQWVYCVAFSPDGRWLATAGWDRTIKLRDAATGEERLTIFAHEGFVLDLAFSPDSRCLASSSEDRSVRLWGIPTGRRIGVFHGHTYLVQAVAFAPDGRELASGGLEGTMKVWDRRKSLPIVIEGFTTKQKSLWYRRDGGRIVFSMLTPDRSHEITEAWDPSTGEPDPTLTGIAPAKLREDYVGYVIPDRPGVPPASATSPDGRYRARVVRSNPNIFETGERSKSYATSAVDVQDEVTGRVRTLIGHTADVLWIAFSPDGKRIATTGYDRTIKLWDTATGRDVFTLRGHTAGVGVLAFSPDGCRIVSSAIDGTARVWDATPLPAAVLQAEEERYKQKIKELKTFRERSETEEHAPGANLLSKQSGR